MAARPVRIVMALVAVALTAGSLSSCSGATPTSTHVVVREVVDGDTVVLRWRGRDETARLIGVDTPETKHPTKPVECFGPEATTFTERLLPPNTAVRAERDVEARDHFGRVLVYLFRADDGVFVNLELARHGYARPLAIAPNTARTGEMSRASSEARSAGRGLWGACGR